MGVSKKEAAVRLGISTKTLERKMFDGSISYYKVGTRILLDTADLDAYLRKCRRPAKETEGAA